jgi:arylsulfatase A-like enzyme
MLGLSQRGFGLSDYSKHLVQFLKMHGYHTVLCGIQHEAGSYFNHREGAQKIGYDEDITTDPAKYAEEELVKWDLENAKKVCEWLRKWKSDKPFFLSYGLYATHRKFPNEGLVEIDSNYIAPPYPLFDHGIIREDYKKYLYSASWFDRAFQIVMDTLKTEGLYDDSIIIFTTDHGIAFPFSKCTLYDSGIGVSLIMRVPGSRMNGEVIDGLVSHVDMFPTLCDLLQLEKPDYLQGFSFAELFRDKTIDVREEIFSEINFHTSYEPARCIRTKRYKYIRYYDEQYLKINLSNIDNSDSKDYYLNNGLQQEVKYQEALYDLLFDPGERNNLVDDERYQDVLEEMRKRLLTYQEETDDPLLKGHIQIQPNWKVNKRECINPSSKNPEDYL